jgi:hypothetical protein
MVALVTLSLSLGFENRIHAQTPRIDSIGGYTSSDLVINGRWTGQPSRAPSSASNAYLGYLAIDTWAWDSSSPSFWSIKGTGFGTARGSVSLDAGVYGPYSFSILSISSWTNTQIQLKVAGLWSFAYVRGLKIVVTTTNGAKASRVDNAVAAPKGRGYGQCTWEVFFQRKAAGLTPPPTAYPINRSAITAGYVPSRWDVLYWGDAHTAMITSNPQITRSSDGKTVTYRFNVTERNAQWDEKMTVRTSEFIVRSGVVTQGILSNMSATSKATSFWR